MEELLKLLGMETPQDMNYAESFCELMEREESIDEGLFFRLFSEVSADTLKELVQSYFEEIVSAVPDDNLEFYTFMSSYKRNLRGLINYCREENDLRKVIAELYKFREWYQESETVACTDLDENRDFLATVCEALVLGRMERLSLGSYSFDFENAMNLQYDEYEDYADDEDSQYDYDNLEDDSDNTLIDKDNPVIEGEGYENYGKGKYLQ